MVGRVTRSQSKKTDEPAAAATPAKKEEKPSPVKAKKTPAKKKEAAKPKSPAKGKGGKKGAAGKKKDEPEETKDVETEEAEKKEEETEEKEEGDEKEDAKEEDAKDEKDKKKVEVEACKQWSAFKTRAEKIRKAVGDKAIVEINVVKPGKGNFVVKVSGCEKPIVELLGMKRPFPALKGLDMEVVTAQVLKALES